MCGGLENASSGSPFVGTNGPVAAFFGVDGGDNDYWSAFFPTEAAMLQEMRVLTQAKRITKQPGLNAYTCYKKVRVAEPNPSAAVQKGMFWDGYAILGNNCLGNTTKVATAYGVDRDLRRRWHNLRPRGFFFDVLSAYDHVPLEPGGEAARTVR